MSDQTLPSTLTLPQPPLPAAHILSHRATDIVLAYLEGCETRNQHLVDMLGDATQQLGDVVSQCQQLVAQMQQVVDELSLLTVNRELERTVLQQLQQHLP